MTTILAAPPTKPKVPTHERPPHLRSLRHPLTRREAMDMFARHEMAETFARYCA